MTFEKDITGKLKNIKMNIKTCFDKNTSEFIFLKFSISNQLKEIIKNSIVDEVTDYDFYNGVETEQRTRYKVKRWVFSSLVSPAKQAIFDEDLVTKSCAKFGFTSVRSLDDFMKGIKKDIKNLIETQLKYSDIDCTVNFSVSK